jgi:hypothetical protein
VPRCPQPQPVISGMSSPCSAMYCLWAMFQQRIASEPSGIVTAIAPRASPHDASLSGPPDACSALLARSRHPDLSGGPGPNCGRAFGQNAYPEAAVRTPRLPMSAFRTAGHYVELRIPVDRIPIETLRVSGILRRVSTDLSRRTKMTRITWLLSVLALLANPSTAQERGSAQCWPSCHSKYRRSVPRAQWWRSATRSERQWQWI